MIACVITRKEGRKKQNISVYSTNFVQNVEWDLFKVDNEKVLFHPISLQFDFSIKKY